MVFAMVMDHHNRARAQSVQAPLRLIVCGTAGTGKSKIIHLLRSHLRNARRVVAPSGVAAHNIGGVTIHSLLHLPINGGRQGELPVPSPQVMRVMQTARNGVKYLIIDERSCVGHRMLYQIDARLRQVIPGGQNHPFGGLSVLMLGDDAQLPPVNDRCMYTSPVDNIPSTFGYVDYRSFEDCVLLSTVMRQADGPFRSCLNRVRNAVPVDQDVQLLRGRVVDSLDPQVCIYVACCG